MTEFSVMHPATNPRQRHNQMKDDFGELKQRIDIAEEIKRRTGFELKRVGKDVDLSECPFCGGHDCFRIDPGKQLFHCFQCNAAGDIYNFIQKQQGCSAEQALKILADAHGYTLSNHPADKRRTPGTDAGFAYADIFQAAAEYYHKALLENNAALGHQKKYRRHSDEALRAFMVGCSDGRLYEHLLKLGFDADRLILSGLVKREGGALKDYFFKSIFIYPHKNREGRVCSFTTKDSNKKFNYRLQNEFKGPDCLFFNMPAFNGNAVFLVEGENDLLSVYGRGAYTGVAAACGAISNAQIDFIKNWAPGKMLYLCFDNDPAGSKYRNQVCEALKDLCLPEALGKILRHETADVRIVRFNPEAKDIDECLRKEPNPREALKFLIDSAERYYPPLKGLVAEYGDHVNKNERKYNFDEVGRICFEWFRGCGKFFIDGEKCFLYFKSKIYEIGNSTAFKALMYDLTGINAASNGARLVWQSIESQAYIKGDHASVPGWICTNLKTGTIYFNLCNEKSELLKISPGRIELVSNGTNPEKVLLRASPKMRPIKFMPDRDIREGMQALRRLFFDNLACEHSDRFFLVCLLVNTVLIQFAKARGIAKLSGNKGSGKTAGAAMISTIIYGEDCVTTGSAASDFSEAAVSPLTISDNLESDAVRGGKRDFLITAATGITRQKRKGGTDSENVYEKSCTQLLVTSIEPFTEPELIERTNEIVFDRIYFNSDFREAMSLEADLAEARDLIWSAIFKLASERILPDIDQKKAEALKKIRTDYPDHSKSRLNELYAMLFIILGEVVKFMPHPEYAKDSFKRECQDLAILKDWIDNQGKRARDTEAESNKILHRLEALVRECLYRGDAFKINYGIESLVTTDEFGNNRSITFRAGTRELFMAFDFLAKDRGISNPFKNTSQLGARIRDALKPLEQAGWEFAYEVKKIRGNRLHEFTKTLDPEE